LFGQQGIFFVYLNKKSMDIQARKIQFIREFLKLKNEDMIAKLENLLQQERQKQYQSINEPMSTETFNSMIDRAEDDSKNSRITSAGDLKNEIDTWS